MKGSTVKNATKSSPVRRFETHKSTDAGRLQTLQRKQVRAFKYGTGKR